MTKIFEYLEIVKCYNKRFCNIGLYYRYYGIDNSTKCVYLSNIIKQINLLNLQLVANRRMLSA